MNGLRGWALLKLAVILFACLAVICTLAFVQAPLRMEAKGGEIPRDRQIVYSAMSGKIVEVKAQHGESIAKRGRNCSS